MTMRETGCEFWEYEIRDTRYAMRVAGYGIRVPGYEMGVAGYEIRALNPGSRIPLLVSRIASPTSRIPNPASRFCISTSVEEVRSGGVYLTNFSSVPTSVRGKAEIFLSMGYGCLPGWMIQRWCNFRVCRAMCMDFVVSGASLNLNSMPYRRP